MKRAAIYDPYLDTGGGGERYVLTFAIALRDAGWIVELQWKDQKILKWIEERLGLNLEGISVIDSINKGVGYDLCFWLSDGSIPLLFSKKNILHFQTPFQNVGGNSFVNKLKFLKINKVVCNSKFTKNVIDREYGIDSSILYPPVGIKDLTSGKKENIILSVGRFSQLQTAKRQDILVEVFINMYKKGLKGWQLVLVGGSNIGAGNFVEELKDQAKDYPIKIFENAPYTEVKKLYGKAKIFWSAAGFNINEERTPRKVEHFGIAVVEAMSAGCVPFAIKKGGHKEIIENKINGFLWESLDELQSLTNAIINNERRMSEIAKNAEATSNEYSEERFTKSVMQLVGNN